MVLTNLLTSEIALDRLQLPRRTTIQVAKDKTGEVIADDYRK